MRGQVLGPLRIERNDEELQIPAPKDRAILSYLALRAPEPVSDDDLIDAAWGAVAPADAPALLRASLERMSELLGPGAIVAVPGGGHRLQIERGAVDAHEFLDAVDGEPRKGAERLDVLRSALDLWRGPALPDVAPSSAAGVDAASLEQRRLEIEEDLVAEFLEAGRPDEALASLERMVEAQPARGRRWALLAATLRALGRTDDAEHTVERARAVLGDVGVVETIADPGPAASTDRLPDRVAFDNQRLQAGVRTFVFTDIEGSTNKWQRHPEAMTDALALHDRLLREVCERHGGEVFTHLGDGLGLVFIHPRDAIAASLEIQEVVSAAPWPPDTPLKVRIGIHFGFAEYRDGNFLGPPVNVCARINSIAHGGQTLISGATAELVGGIDTTPLGAHPLRGVDGLIEIHQVGDGDFGSLRGTDPSRTNLPPAGMAIVGREGDVAAIRTTLTDSPVVSIVGPGGSGKTRLALEVAHEELLNREAGAYFVDLTGVRHDDDVASATAAALRLTVASDDAQEVVVGHLRDQDALVVLDNCEHVIDGVADLVEVVAAGSPSARIITTSIEALDVDAEHVHVLEPLSTEHFDGPAVELLIQRAHRVAPDLAIDAESEALALNICRRLDGLPLALELAASRLGVLSLEDLDRHLEDRFSVLRSGGRRRAKTMEATVAWSYGLLDADEQRCFRQLGIFAGPFDVAAAAAVLAEPEIVVVDHLEELVAKSLLSVDRAGAQNQFRLLETLRAYARLRLVEQGEAATARDAHLRHHLDVFVPEDGTVLVSSRDVVVARGVHGDLVAAYAHAVDSDRWEDAARLSFLLTSISAMTGTGVPTGLDVDADRFGPDDPIGGMLLVARTLHAVAIDDWGSALRIAQHATSSPLPAVAGTGCWLLAFTSALVESDAAGPMLAKAADHLTRIEPGTLNARSVGAGVTYARAAPAAMRGDVDEARESCRDWYRKGPYAELVGTEPHLLTELAVTEIIDGNPAAALALLDRDDVDEFLQASSVVVKVAALALSGDVAAARSIAMPFAREAMLGRIARMANDALVGLAAVLVASDHETDAIELLSAARGARAPHIGMLAAHLAERLGVADEVARHIGDPIYSREDARPELEQALAHPAFR